MGDLASVLASVRSRAGRLVRAHAVHEDAAPADVESDNAELSRYAEEGAAEIAARSDALLARAAIAATAGTAAYAVPASVGELLRVAFTPSGGVTRLLEITGGERIRQWVTSSKAKTETPSFVGLFGASLYLYGIPDAAGTLEVLYRPLSAIGESEGAWASDEAPAGDLVAYLPRGLEQALEDYVLSRWWQGVGEAGQAASMRGSFEAALLRHGQRRGRQAARTTTRAVNQII